MIGSRIDHTTAHLLDVRAPGSLDVLGPRIELLTTPAEQDNVPCIMRGTVPTGAVIPLHSHPDPETFIAVSGEIEGLAQSPSGSDWLRLEPGDVFHVPGGAGHGFRNVGSEPAVMIIISTSKIGRFFREVGKPCRPGEMPAPPSQDEIQTFLRTADRYGYWNASPEENARAGVPLPPMR
jgi:quercetin dioxygenase-like cupin family protein